MTEIPREYFGPFWSREYFEPVVPFKPYKTLFTLIKAKFS